MRAEERKRMRPAAYNIDAVALSTGQCPIVGRGFFLIWYGEDLIKVVLGLPRCWLRRRPLPAVEPEVAMAKRCDGASLRRLGAAAVLLWTAGCSTGNIGSDFSGRA